MKFAVKFKIAWKKCAHTFPSIWLKSRNTHTCAWIVTKVLQRWNHWMLIINIITESIEVGHFLIFVIYSVESKNQFQCCNLYFSSCYESNVWNNPDESNGTDNRNQFTLAHFFTMRCDMCDDGRFSSFQGAKEHYTKSHGVVGYLVCCEKKFVKAKTVDDHFQWHINPEIHK